MRRPYPPPRPPPLSLVHFFCAVLGSKELPKGKPRKGSTIVVGTRGILLYTRERKIWSFFPGRLSICERREGERERWWGYRYNGDEVMGDRRESRKHRA